MPGPLQQTIPISVRKGQGPKPLDRHAFHIEFEKSFYDPRFDAEREALMRIEDIAWKNYSEGRKSPITRKAGRGFADPSYELSAEWREARDRIFAAERLQRD